MTLEVRVEAGDGADGFPDAPHVVVDVTEQTQDDELLSRHGLCVAEDRSSLRQLLVVQATDNR